MMTCFASCCGLFIVLCSLPDVSPAWCAAPPLSAHFRDEPADALIRRLEAGPGLTVAASPSEADVPGSHWRIETRENGDVIATDPVTGLVMRQKHRWEPSLQMLFIETTLSNSGKTVQKVGNVRIGSWTFRVLDAQDAARYRDLTHRSDTWYGSTYWAGPDWTRVGKDWHHPGNNTPSVRRFTAPRDGRVTITGRVYKADARSGDGVRLSIRHGKETVWKAEIDGTDAKGVSPNLTFDVRQGNAIRFVVHKRGAITCDTTHWDPLVTYADGPRFQASEGFRTKRENRSPWFYEMEVDRNAEIGLPRVHGFDSELALWEQTPSITRPVSLNHREALPMLVVADGADKSGVAIILAGNRPWHFRSVMTNAGQLRVELAVTHGESRLSLSAGQTIQLPKLGLAAYRGSWPAGVTAIERLLSSTLQDQGIDDLRRQVAAALSSATAPLDSTSKPSPRAEAPVHRPELDLWAMVQAEWRHQDKLALTAESYAEATARHIEKTRRLLADLRSGRADSFLAAETDQLGRLAVEAKRSDLSLEQRRGIYFRVRWLKRRIAMANPLMRFGKLLCCKRVPTSYSHEVMQYYGWRARPGGGLFVLENPGHSLAARDILGGKLAGGNVLEPRLSYDAKRIVFSFVECSGKQHDPDKLLNDVDVDFYHIYEVNIDGARLRQLTRGPYEDLMPTYLPDGGIVFCSSRRRGHSRCFGGQFSRRWQVYTLHRMDGDGKNIRTLSFHDTNEWFPAVSDTGLILYSRWDYIDRDAVTHQNLWATRPDGTNPIAVWGNATASPNCTFQIQPIPDSKKIVFTASAHHSVTAGSIAIVDPTRGNDGQQAITRITPEVPFPEAEGRNISEYYAAPWPLSEKYFLVAYSPKPLVWEPGANEPDALGIYLLDAFGNRELIYRDAQIGSTNPCPLVPRQLPPVMRNTLPADAEPTGEMVLLDVYQGLGDVPRGTIKRLRIIQIFPKTTHRANFPPIGLAGEENARAILGTVPVESDGSARFTVPAGKLILFQALDKDGFAYQTMRSVTYVQPGERVSCIGCHESRMTAPATTDTIAARRRPSRIEPGELGGRPFSFVSEVQPVLEKRCVKCHGAEKPDGDIDLTGRSEKGFTKSYWALCGDKNFNGAGTNPKNAAEALVPRFGARNQIQITPPGGMYGALGSRLIKILRKGHYDVKLTAGELQRLAAWIDCNAVFYGAYSAEDQAKELRGEVLAMPEIQ